MGKLTIQNGKKLCRKCLKTKAVVSFGFTKDDRFNKKYIDSQCKECRKKSTYAWRKKNPKKSRAIDLRSGEKLKILIHSKYGKDGKPECVNCGFSDIRALCVDHILDNGAEQRLSLKDKYFAGKNFYRWLRDNEFPPGYQSLCANCNLIKEIERRRNANNHTL